MKVPLKSLRIPSTFAAPADPIDENPFPIEDARHKVWKEATAQAEEQVCRIKSGAHDALAPDTAFEWLPAVVVAQFDVWAERGVKVVWSDAAVQHYGGWLVSYANAWLETVAQFYEKNPHPLPGHAEGTLLAIRNVLGARVQHWTAEARRYRGEQEAHRGQQAGGAAATEPTAATWEDVTIEFTSDFQVRITVKTRTFTLTYGDLGFDDRKGDKPNSAWIMLRKLAEKGGAIDVPFQTREKVEKRMQEIRRTLRAYFLKMGVEIPPKSDPLRHNRRAKEYCARFRIRSRKSSDPNPGEVSTDDLY
jgi:hypothetical protein